jgi:hypothetical protein
MRELIYLSPRKLNAFHLQSRMRRIPQGEAEISALGARVRVAYSIPSPGEASDPSAKLARVAKYLKKKAKQVTDPTLRPGEWFIFDCEMSYGEIKTDEGIGPLVFSTPTALEGGGGTVLLGSASNLTGRAVEVGETKFSWSMIEWLGTWLEDDERHMPRSLDSTRPLDSWQRLTITMVTYYLKRDNPILPCARVSGLARLQFHCPPIGRLNGETISGTLSVGTPLYVELGPWNPKW